MRRRFTVMRTALASLVAAMAPVLLPAASDRALADDASRTPEQVIRHHFEATAARDLDAVVSDYADDAVLITANGVTHGKAAVRAAFQQLLRGPQPAAKPAGDSAARQGGGPQIVASHYTRTVAWLMWVRNAGAPDELHGVETYLVRNGRIELETVGTVAVHPASRELNKP